LLTALERARAAVYPTGEYVGQESFMRAGQIGSHATAEPITAPQLWSDWLGNGRVRKFALVAEKR
jgi:hypothetical protein